MDVDESEVAFGVCDCERDLGCIWRSDCERDLGCIWRSLALVRRTGEREVRTADQALIPTAVIELLRAASPPGQRAISLSEQP